MSNCHKLYGLKLYPFLDPLFITLVESKAGAFDHFSLDKSVSIATLARKILSKNSTGVETL